ncbi:hypothetical protein [Sorangium sp. So ce233]
MAARGRVAPARPGGIAALPSALPGVQTIEDAKAAYENVLALVDAALCE